MLPSRPLSRAVVRASLMTFAATLALCACKKPDAAAVAAAMAANKGADAVPVEVAKVERRSIAASYSNTAALSARGNAVVTSRASGVVTQVFVDVGTQVREGQTLIQLDTDMARLNVAQAQASAENLQAQYARAQQLVKQQMMSVNDVDQLKYNLEMARAQLGTAKLALQYATIVAPISGVVSDRPDSVKPGNLVQIGQSVVTIVDAGHLEATLNVSERDITILKVGQAVDLQVDALPGKRFNGKVVRVSPVVDSGSGTFKVVCGFDSQGVLQSGMYGHLTINYDSRADALVIPRNALLEDGGDPAVYAIRNGKAQRATLKLGYSEAGYVEVRDGLKLGEQVVTAGKAALREGSAVQVLTDAATATATATPAPTAAQAAH